MVTYPHGRFVIKISPWDTLKKLRKVGWTAPKHAGMALRTLRYLPGGCRQGFPPRTRNSAVMMMPMRLGEKRRAGRRRRPARRFLSAASINVSLR
jgi:hypothetical protein